MRVFELCDIANQAEVIQLALKYASKISRDFLVNKLAELLTEQKTRTEVVEDTPEPNER